jgi:PadR family transcriptional regulator AphA
MSLKYAILGFIDMVPLSGYDLKKMFDASVNYYWPATHSQIYRTLDRMLQDGLVTQEVVHQEDHPDKKVYSIADRRAPGFLCGKAANEIGSVPQ